jgi:hypothetical protein
MSIALQVLRLIQGFQARESELNQQLAEALANDHGDADAAVAAENAAAEALRQVAGLACYEERLAAVPNDAMAQLEALEGLLNQLSSSEP